jgi:hypothetical protein
MCSNLFVCKGTFGVNNVLYREEIESCMFNVMDGFIVNSCIIRCGVFCKLLFRSPSGSAEKKIQNVDGGANLGCRFQLY